MSNKINNEHVLLLADEMSRAFKEWTLEATLDAFQRAKEAHQSYEKDRNPEPSKPRKFILWRESACSYWKVCERQMFFDDGFETIQVTEDVLST